MAKTFDTEKCVDALAALTITKQAQLGAGAVQLRKDVSDPLLRQVGIAAPRGWSTDVGLYGLGGAGLGGLLGGGLSYLRGDDREAIKRKALYGALFGGVGGAGLGGAGSYLLKNYKIQRPGTTGPAGTISVKGPDMFNSAQQWAEKLKAQGVNQWGKYTLVPQARGGSALDAAATLGKGAIGVGDLLFGWMGSPLKGGQGVAGSAGAIVGAGLPWGMAYNKYRALFNPPYLKALHEAGHLKQEPNLDLRNPLERMSGWTRANSITSSNKQQLLKLMNDQGRGGVITLKGVDYDEHGKLKQIDPDKHPSPGLVVDTRDPVAAKKLVDALDGTTIDSMMRTKRLGLMKAGPYRAVYSGPDANLMQILADKDNANYEDALIAYNKIMADRAEILRKGGILKDPNPMPPAKIDYSRANATQIAAQQLGMEMVNNPHMFPKGTFRAAPESGSGLVQRLLGLTDKAKPAVRTLSGGLLGGATGSVLGSIWDYLGDEAYK